MQVGDVVEYQGDTWEVTWTDGDEAEITNTFGYKMFVDFDELRFQEE